jgi:hypothetical protein
MTRAGGGGRNRTKIKAEGRKGGGGAEGGAPFWQPLFLCLLAAKAADLAHGAGTGLKGERGGKGVVEGKIVSCVVSWVSCVVGWDSSWFLSGS